MNFRRGTRVQLFFARMRRYKDWTVIVGETLAVISASSTFIPGLPLLFKDMGIPLAIIIGSSALLLAAVFDKCDPTKPPTVVGEDPPTKELFDRLPDGASYIQRERDPFELR